MWNSEEEHFWGYDKLKAKVCQWMQTEAPGFSMGITQHILDKHLNCCGDYME